jgi:1A family penicillin-binding protein
VTISEKHVGSIASGLLVLGLLALGAGIGLAWAVPLPELPHREATRIFDAHGELVASVFEQNRVEVPLALLPAHLPAAALAVEDRHFYRHPGVNPIAILRALYRNLRAGRVVEGGSTITQQVARTLFLEPDRTLIRKLRELLWTFRLELALTKDEILQAWLNNVYLGHGAYGVEVAARTYFGKSATDVTLAEAALLVGLARGPNLYSPYRNPDRALDRRRTVLDAMADVGAISRETAMRAAGEPLQLAGRPQVRRRAPYFADWVVDELLDRRPDLAAQLAVGGLRIHTTLDLRIQAAAESAVDRFAPAGLADDQGVAQPQTALVVLDPDNGHVLAMVGGRDYAQTQLNRAVAPDGGGHGMRRLPGSAFKPLLYAAVIDLGFPTTSRVMCEPIAISEPGAQPYAPRDYGPKPFHDRALTIREALATSCNVVAVRWAHRLGPALVAAYARRLGIDSRIRPVLSIPLGTSEVAPLELASAYATLAAGGVRRPPVGLLRVQDRRGRLLYVHRPHEQIVLREEVAYVVTDLMRSVMLPGGTGSRIGVMLGQPAAGKTGTTSGRHDAWMAGYTADLVAVVWVGRDRPAPLPGGGASLAGPIWADVLRRASEIRGVGRFVAPPGVVRVRVCALTGNLAEPTCPDGGEEPFLAGNMPPRCPLLHSLPAPQDQRYPGEGEQSSDDRR